MSKVFRQATLAWLFVVGIVVNLSYIAYLGVYPFKTIDYYNLPFPVVHKVVSPTDPLLYTVDYCRYTDSQATVTKTLQGASVITISQQSTSLLRGCHKTTVSNVFIPSYTPKGEYTLLITSCYQINPLRNICHQLSTESFEVR